LDNLLNELIDVKKTSKASIKSASSSKESPKEGKSLFDSFLEDAQNSKTGQDLEQNDKKSLSQETKSKNTSSSKNSKTETASHVSTQNTPTISKTDKLNDKTAQKSSIDTTQAASSSSNDSSTLNSTSLLDKWVLDIKNTAQNNVNAQPTNEKSEAKKENPQSIKTTVSNSLFDSLKESAQKQIETSNPKAKEASSKTTPLSKKPTPDDSNTKTTLTPTKTQNKESTDSLLNSLKPKKTEETSQKQKVLQNKDQTSKPSSLFDTLVDDSTRENSGTTQKQFLNKTETEETLLKPLKSVQTTKSIDNNNNNDVIDKEETINSSKATKDEELTAQKNSVSIHPKSLLETSQTLIDTLDFNQLSKEDINNLQKIEEAKNPQAKTLNVLETWIKNKNAAQKDSFKVSKELQSSEIQHSEEKQSTKKTASLMDALIEKVTRGSTQETPQTKTSDKQEQENNNKDNKGQNQDQSSKQEEQHPQAKITLPSDPLLEPAAKIEEKLESTFHYNKSLAYNLLQGSKKTQEILAKSELLKSAYDTILKNADTLGVKKASALLDLELQEMDFQKASGGYVNEEEISDEFINKHKNNGTQNNHSTVSSLMKNRIAQAQNSLHTMEQNNRDVLEQIHKQETQKPAGSNHIVNTKTLDTARTQEATLPDNSSKASLPSTKEVEISLPANSLLTFENRVSLSKLNMQSFMGDVARSMAENYKPPVTAFRIVLNPASLGSIEVMIKQEAGTDKNLNIHLNIRNASTHEMFTGNQNDLKIALTRNLGSENFLLNMTNASSNSNTNSNAFNGFGAGEQSQNPNKDQQQKNPRKQAATEEILEEIANTEEKTLAGSYL
jgi:hypothetical protein